MWAIKILSPPQVGQVIPLKEGSNIIGRSTQCDIVLKNKEVSKKHARLKVSNDKVVLTDLDSANGTFLKGVHVKQQNIEHGDNFSVHNMLLCLVDMSAEQKFNNNTASSHLSGYSNQTSHGSQSSNQSNWNANNTGTGFRPNNNVGETLSPPVEHENNAPPKEFMAFFKYYFDHVAMPSIYHLAELMEYKNLIFALFGILVVVIASLSVIPMVQITQSSIESESKRRALTIARNLARSNEAALLQGVESAVSVQIAQVEEGVKSSLIIAQNDGHIIAPAEQSGKYPDEAFFHSARREKKEQISKVGLSTIGASVPISFFDSRSGQYVVKAHAVVLYDMGNLAIDDGRALSLFIQTLGMALIVGWLMYLIIYRLMEYPIAQLNKEIDTSLKGQGVHVHIKFRYPVLNKLVENINTALSKMSQDKSELPNLFVDRRTEAQNLLTLISLPGIIIQGEDETIVFINPAMEDIAGINFNDLQRSAIDKIPDQALRLSVKDLIQRSRNEPHLITINQINFGGNNYELCMQAVFGTTNIAYFILTVHPPQDGVS